MIDPLLSLSFAMQANKGVYALLVGSGVSRAAQVPTGWEVVLDLIAKLAHIQGEDCARDPVAWYRTKHREEPDYSKLLDAIAKSPEERQQLLRGYFEPTEDEREQGLKLPTAAHRAIAELVARGYVRVIITTNFDRLIERAIEDVGITPTVISTIDAVSGTLPLVHQKCCIIKVHGDYLDSRIKNTREELSSYDANLNVLLDRVFDEFGVVICGWSAQWDPALIAAFERCKTRRFTTYWAARGALSDSAQRLLVARAGLAVNIKDADAFFTELSEKVIALEDLQRPHPQSVAAATAIAKRLLVDEKGAIRLHDLVHDETERAFAAVQSAIASTRSLDGKQRFARLLEECCAAIELLRAVCIQGAYWGNTSHQRLFSLPIQRLAVDPTADRGGESLKEELRAVPSMILLYSSGIAAVAGANIGMLGALLSHPTLTRYGTSQPLITMLYWQNFQDWFKLLPGAERQYFAASEWLFRDVREPLRHVLPDDHEFERQFDRFEMLLSLVRIELNRKGDYETNVDQITGSPGRFIWKFASRGERDDPYDQLRHDATVKAGLRQAGLFLKKDFTYEEAIDALKAFVARMSPHYC